MDEKQVSPTAGESTKSVGRVAVLCAPFAARWDREAWRRHRARTPEALAVLRDARQALREARRELSKAQVRAASARSSSHPMAAARKATRAEVRDAKLAVRRAEQALRAARRSYPEEWIGVAFYTHAAHTITTGVVSAVASSPWPVAASAGLITLNASVLGAGRRAIGSVEMSDGLSSEERELMGRLMPEYWKAHAASRGLDDTVTTPPAPTPAGIVCAIRLDNRWSVPKFRAEADAIRALLGMRTGTRLEIESGARGNWARITVRTRSASDGVSMVWTPEHDGIGVDEVTGEIVDIPLKPGIHILLAGITGMGKSVSWRGLFLRAARSDNWAPVLIDPKRQEAINVQHAVRTVGQEPDREKRMADIYAMILELTKEMHRRQGMATGSTWTPDGRPENRFLLVIIDEGAAIVRMSKDKRYKDVLDKLDELWGEARAVGYQFIWATQNPTKTGGIPALVKDNMSVRMSLTTGAGEAERAIFGENAQQTGWTPSTLDEVPGRAMIQHGKRRPDPVRMWLVTDDVMAGLPAEDPWRTPAPGDAPAVMPAESPAVPDEPLAFPGMRPALRVLQGGGEGIPATQAEADDGDQDDEYDEFEFEDLEVTNKGRVSFEIEFRGARSSAEIARRTGLNKGTVSKEVNGLIAEGTIRRNPETGALEVVKPS